MAEKADPFEIAAAPMPIPGGDQIVIRNHAVGINLVDGVHQKFAFFPLHCPTILGQDVAGVVDAVGPNVTRFKKGDRVLGHGAGIVTGANTESAFQNFTLLRTVLVSEIPDEVSFESAAVLPLVPRPLHVAIFQKDFLNTQFPTDLQLASHCSSGAALQALVVMRFN
jgi:NADPH:quinone reductase-like Zn-dependent oxidoreductase